MPHYTVKVHH